MGESRQRWLEKQLSVGFLALSDRGRIKSKKSASSWSELGLYLMGVLEMKQLSCKRRDWKCRGSGIGEAEELEDS